MASVREFLNRRQTETPKEAVGIGGFTAFARVRDTYELSADVPDVPVEDGSQVHDHIILKPVILTIEGNVSDVHARAIPETTERQIEFATIGDFTSQYGLERTSAQLSRVAALENDINDAQRRAQGLVDAGQQITRLFGNRAVGSKGLQERFLDEMEGLYYGRQLFAIDMPNRRHDNMVITRLQINTDNQTGSTSFTLDVKQITLAELQFVRTKAAPGTGGQLEDQADKGVQEGEEVEQSALSSISEALGVTIGD